MTGFEIQRCRWEGCRKRFNQVRNRSCWCPKHKSRIFKRDHPVQYAYNKIKYRAIQRGHAFDLSFEQFKKFAIDSGWLDGKGKEATSLSIDRINETKGYSVDNVRVITLSENTAKQMRSRYVNRTW